ncbi:hypothetical protein AMTRI_Chr06g199160 [Amborella trichopoda]|uniref:Chalcone isomerase domain-containing protein n=1 Tax=Amborella trichopoda TaxID=13333 RepID=W1Q0B0_AMBTC|nr:fatty-acid-binding protein 1 [Amborella trichopoda]ERN13811.1 hypothetical protein AMTR_s00049p00212050 [Amborella trichopoda]|eukprot:XP_006852344.1 fatty-acid-binding protein 1 [Amborella trichopoda]
MASSVEGKGNEGANIEPKTGVSFPIKLGVDGHGTPLDLNGVGLRKKSIMGFGLKIYSFGIYADNNKLREQVRSKFGEGVNEVTKEIFELVIDSDAPMMVRLVMVFGGLTMSLVRKSLDEGIGASIKKLTGQKHEELLNKLMGEVQGGLKLPTGSIIEISRLPGFVLQTKVKGEVVGKTESELLCRAYFNMYLGEDPFDQDAKESFGKFLISSF